MAFFLAPVFTAPSWAAPKTLSSAKLTWVVDDQLDLWINGNQVVRGAGITQPPDPAVQELDPCIFKKDNLMALRVQSNPGNFDGKDRVGAAYVLRLTYSDGSKEALSSTDTDEQKGFFLLNAADLEPAGWNGAAFDDSKWRMPLDTGPSLSWGPTAKDGPYDGNFLSANRADYFAERSGERHLFRRKFKMKGEPAVCESPTATPTQAPPTRTPTPTPTPQPPPRATSTWTPRPKPTSTWTARHTATPRPPPPTATPVLVRRTPRALPKVPTPKPFLTFTPTRTRVLPTPTPVREFKAPPTSTPLPPRRATSTPTRTPTALPALVEPKPRPTLPPLEAERVYYVRPPVSLLVSFSDGRGRYEVLVYDGSGNVLKRLFDKRITALPEQWVQWDGRMEDGREAPVGSYEVRLLRDGQVIRRVSVIRRPE